MGLNSLMPRELLDHHGGDRLTGGYLGIAIRSAGPSYSIQLKRMVALRATIQISE
jgi:hypothetical protein